MQIIIIIKLLTNYFLYSVNYSVFAGEGLLFLSSGKWGIILAIQSIWICKGRLYLFYFIETSYSWMMVKMAAERVLALKFPFWRRYGNYKKVTKLARVLVFVFAVVSAIPVFLNAEIVSKPNVANLVCGVSTERTFLQVLYLFVTTMNLVIYPIIFQICLAVLLSVQLLSLMKKRENLIGGKVRQHGNHESRREGKEKTAAIIVWTLLTAYIIATMPTSILWSIAMALNYFYGSSSQTILNLSQIFLFLSTFPHVWNIYIYIWRIPNFFKELVSGCRCTEETRGN